MSLAKKTKIGLDETRILVLGSQILLGFGFQLAFQKKFQDLSVSDAALEIATLFLITLATGLIIAPSAQHRIVEEGADSPRLLAAIRRCAALALGPFALALGIDIFLVTARIRGNIAGALAGIAIAAGAGFFWYGAAYWTRRRERHRPLPAREEGPTSLEKKIEQMLTETRVVLPGAQALLGFQLIIVFSEPFEKLSSGARDVHLVAIGFIALATVWLMAPAAFHRIVYDGDDTAAFHRLGTRFLLAASVALALGIGADLGVVADKVSGSGIVGFASGGVAASGLLALWLFYPLALRRRADR